MIYAYLEIIRLIGWITVLSMTVYNKKHCHVDIFWMRVISSVLMMMGSINDLTSVETIHYKSLWWFFGNVFIIIFYIYMIVKDVTNKKLKEND